MGLCLSTVSRNHHLRRKDDPAKTSYQYHCIAGFSVLIWSNDCRSYNSADMAKEIYRILNGDRVVLHASGGIGKIRLILPIKHVVHTINSRTLHTC